MAAVAGKRRPLLTLAGGRWPVTRTEENACPFATAKSLTCMGRGSETPRLCPAVTTFPEDGAGSVSAWIVSRIHPDPAAPGSPLVPHPRDAVCLAQRLWSIWKVPGTVLGGVGGRGRGRLCPPGAAVHAREASQGKRGAQRRGAKDSLGCAQRDSGGLLRGGEADAELRSRGRSSLGGQGHGKHSPGAP